MGRFTRWPRRLGLVFMLSAFFVPVAGDCVAAPASGEGKPSAVDCASWTLDGYRLGMRGDELLAIRSLTLHVEGQAQVIEPGRFRGVLVLNSLNSLEKWDVIYQTQDGTALRAQIRERFGEPASDVSGNISDEDASAGRQHRTIWWSQTCDVALIVYEDNVAGEAAGHTVHAALTRASRLPRGLIQWKTLHR